MATSTTQFLIAALVALTLISLADICVTMTIHHFVTTNQEAQVRSGRKNDLALPLIPPIILQPSTILKATISQVVFIISLVSLALLLVLRTRPYLLVNRAPYVWISFFSLITYTLGTSTFILGLITQARSASTHFTSANEVIDLIKSGKGFDLVRWTCDLANMGVQDTRTQCYLQWTSQALELPLAVLSACIALLAYLADRFKTKRTSREELSVIEEECDQAIWR